MKIMPCSLNGPRNISEFACSGEVAEMVAREKVPEMLLPFRVGRFATFDLAYEMGASAASL